MNTTIKILTLTLITLLLNIQTTKAQCNQEDWNALKTLYDSTGGNNWKIQTGWDIHIASYNNPPTNCNLGDLYGVELDENGRVSCIDLDGAPNCDFASDGGNGLTGTIPPEIENLSHLIHLNLSNNSLSGNLPSTLGNLSNLIQLHLQNNYTITGSIPVELANLNNLEELFLFNNLLSGSLPSELGNLTNLIILNTSWNNLTGTIPAAFENLDNLEKLYLIGNTLSGSIPTELENLNSLMSLRIGINQFTGSIPIQLTNMNSLTELDLGQNNLTGTIPVELGNMVNLEELRLNNNNLTGPIPSELGNLINLIELSLHYNDITGSIPTQIGNLTSLNTLRLEGNELTGTIPVSIGNLINLDYLSLSHNSLEGSIPTEIGNLTNLVVLNLGNNLLAGSIPVELSFLGQLRHLLLVTNNLIDTIPGQLGLLTNLESLWLSSNEFSGSIPEELSSLKNLYVLGLDNNKLNGSIPYQLSNLTSLGELYLNGNELSGNIPSSLGNLSNLEELWLHENELIGSIPSEFCDLVNLFDFRIFSNLLTGCYPACLNVFCNQLTYSDISYENNFDSTWENFCATGLGCCESNCDNPLSSNVYPGDLNNDGIVNNQDIGLWGLFKYETGPPRASGNQNINWTPYPAEDWNRLQINNEDIKHFDTNGNGVIEDDDCQAVTDNFGETWSPATTVEIPEPPEESDYQVMLHPIEQVFDGNLVMNVSLERRAGGSMEIRGGHFTVDYSDIEGDISTAALNFLPISWLGTPTINLWYESTPFPSEKRIEVGFTKINNINSQGSGVIGQLILEYDNSGARLSENTDMYEFRVNTIGVHNSSEFIQMEDQVLQVNVDDADYCQPNWMIDENTPFQNQYKSDNDITTNGMVIIGDAQEVLYKADRITLNSGFSAKAGADFEIKIGGCSE